MIATVCVCVCVCVCERERERERESCTYDNVVLVLSCAFCPCSVDSFFFNSFFFVVVLIH